MSRAVRDHVSRQHDAHVDVGRAERPGRGAMAQGAERMEALNALLGDGDDGLVAEVRDQGLEAGASQ